MAKQKLDFGVNFTATGNFNQLNSSLKRLRAAHTQAFGAMMSPAIATKSPFDSYAKGIAKGTLNMSQLRAVLRNSNAILAEHNALSRANGVVMKDAAGNARTYLDVNRAFGKTLVTSGQRIALMNTLLAAGAKRLITWGKNIQWAGRQVMVGLTLPLAAFGTVAMKAFETFEKQMTRVIKVTNVGLITMEQFGEQVSVFDVMDQSDFGMARMELANESIKRQTIALAEIGAELGFVAGQTAELVAEFSQMGYMGFALDQISEAALTLSRVSGATLSESIQLTRIVAQSFGVELQNLTQAFAELNLVENNTALSLQEMSEAIPIVASVADNMGLSVGMTAGLLAIMKENGIAAREGATALRTGLIKLVQQATPNAIKAFEDINLNLEEMQEEHAGNVLAFMVDLGTQLNSINANSAEGAAKIESFTAALGKLVGVRASARFLSLVQELDGLNVTLDEMGQVQVDASALDRQSRTYRAFMAVIAEEQLKASRVFQRELDLIQNSQAGIASRLRAQINLELTKIGESFLIWANYIKGLVLDVLRAFNDLPEGVRQTIYWMGALLAGIGPVVMIGGVLANAFGQILNVLSKLLPKINLMTAAARAEQLAHNVVTEAIIAETTAKQQLIAVNQGLAASTAQVIAAQNVASISQGLSVKKYKPPTKAVAPIMATGAYDEILAITAAATATQGMTARSLQSALGKGFSMANVSAKGPGGTSVLQVLETNLRKEVDRSIARELAAGTLGVSSKGKKLTGSALTAQVAKRASELAQDQAVVTAAANATAASYANRGAQAQVASMLGLPPQGPAISPAMGRSARLAAEAEDLRAQYRLLSSTGAENLPATMDDYVAQNMPGGRRKTRLGRMIDRGKARFSAFRFAAATGATSAAPSAFERGAAQATARRRSAVGKIKGKASSFTKGITTAMTAAVSKVPFGKQIFSSIAKIGPKIAGLFGGSIGTAIMSALGAVGSTIAAALGTFGIPLALVFGSAIFADPKAFMDGMMGVLAKPLAGLKKAWSQLVDTVKVFFYQLKGGAGEGTFLSKMSSLIGKIIGLIGGTLMNLISSVIRIVIALFKIFQGVFNIVMGIVAIFTGNFKEGIGMIGEGFKNLWDGFKMLVLNAIGFVIEKLESIPLLGRLFRPLGDIVRNAQDAITAVSELTRAGMAAAEELKAVTEELDNISREIEEGQSLMDSLVRYEIITQEEVDNVVEVAKNALEAAGDFGTAEDRARRLAGAVNDVVLEMSGLTDEQRLQLSLYAQRMALEADIQASVLELENLQAEIRQAELAGQTALTDATILEYARQYAEKERLALQAARAEAALLPAGNLRNQQLAILNARTRDLDEYESRIAENRISGSDALKATGDRLSGLRDQLAAMADATKEDAALRAQAAENLANSTDEAEDLEDALRDVNSVVSAFKSAMGEVMSDIQNVTSEIIKMQEEAIEGLFDSVSDNIKDFFDEYLDMIGDQVDAITDAVDAQYDAEEKRIQDIYNAQIDAIQNQMDEEERLEKLREDNFNKEKARIEFLKGLMVSQINIEEATLRGAIGEAAILSVQRSADVQSFFLANVEERYKEISELRKEQMKSEMDLLKEQMEADIDAAEQRKDSAKESIDSSGDAAKEAAENARERAEAEIDAAKEAAEKAREREEQRIENYLREWKRVTPATEEEFAQHTANLQAFLDRSGERLQGEINAINAGLRGSLGSISSEFEGTNNEIVDMINTAAEEAGFSIESIADSLVMNSTNSLMASLSSVEGFVSGMQTGFISAGALTEKFLETFEEAMANGFARARNIAIAELTESNKWENAGDSIMRAIRAGMDGVSIDLPDDFAEQMANYDWGELGRQTGYWGWNPEGVGMGSSGIYPPSGPSSGPENSTPSRTRRSNNRSRGSWYLDYRPVRTPIPGDPDYVDWLEGLTPFAKGGIVTKPIFPALVGESGPEAIIPLSKIGKVVDSINKSSYSYGTSASLSPSRSASQGSSSTYNLSFNINGANLDEDKLAKRVMFEIQKTERSVGMGRRV